MSLHLQSDVARLTGLNVSDNDVEIGDACYVEDDCIVVSEGVTDSELAELLKSL